MIHGQIKVAPGATLNIFALDFEDRQKMLMGGHIKPDEGDHIIGPDDRMIIINAENEEEILAWFKEHIADDANIKFEIRNVDEFSHGG